MWARHVVVQEAQETIRCTPRVVVVAVHPHDGRDDVRRQGGRLVLDLEGGRHHHLFGAGRQVAARGALGGIRAGGGVQELAARVHHEPDAVLGPADFGRVALLAQEPDRDAVDPQAAFRLVDIGYDGAGLMAVEIAMQPPVGGIALDVMGDVGQGGPHLAAEVDHNLAEGFSGHVVPERQLPDAAEAVDAQL